MTPPAFLMSMPRSGSTMLSLMLGAHSAVDCPPEPWLMLVAGQHFRHPLGPKGPYGREQAELATIEFALSLEARRAGAMAETIGAALSPSLLRRLLTADASQRMEALVQAAYSCRLKARGRKLLIDKTPRYYAIVPLIEAVFAKPKIIVLQRHPLDILASYKAIGWGSVPTILDADHPSVFTRDFCEGLFALEALRHRGQANTRVLRYEALASDPQEELSSICGLLGIGYEDAMADFTSDPALLLEHRQSFFGDPNISRAPSPANSLGVGRWHERLTLPEIATAVKFLGMEIFERLGYPETSGKLKALGIEAGDESAASDLRAQAMANLQSMKPEPPLSIWRLFQPMTEERNGLAAKLIALQKDNDDRRGQIETLTTLLKAAQKDNEDRGQQIDTLTALVKESEADRAARGAQIEVLNNLLNER